MSSASQKELIQCVRKYRSLDDRLKELNKEVYKLRENRKIIEIEMTDILKTPGYATIQKLEINDDSSVIKIQRPELWSKPWSLSVKDLRRHLETFWPTGRNKTAEECIEYIVEARKRELIANEFAFTRIQPSLHSGDDGDV